MVASAIKSAMAELGPNEVTNRTKIEPLAQQKLAESLNQKYGEGAVFINKVVINNMDFEEAYNTAIQQKSIAQQNADKQKIENEAAIAKAEADKQVGQSPTPRRRLRRLPLLRMYRLKPTAKSRRVCLIS